MEKRFHQRVPMKNLVVDASDGLGFFKGMISDVSRFGVSISDLPGKINGKAKSMTIIVSGLGKNFKMVVRPRWSSSDGASKTVGAEITSPPWGWTEFVMHNEPQLDDAWDSVKI